MRVIIIGNGVAGVTAAETIRKNNAGCEIEIFSAEKYPYYSRPRIIEYLAGKVTTAQLFIHKSDWYESKNIKIHVCAPVKSVDHKNNRIIATDGKEYGYDYLIIAVGSDSFVPPFPGADNSGIFTLRSIDDADSILAYVRDKRKTAVIGGGLLGIESANCLVAQGKEVTVIEVFDRLLPRQLDNEGAEMLKKMLEAKGIKFLLGKQTDMIEKKGDELTVKFKDGSYEKTEAILISAGIRPSVLLAKEAGIAVNKGIIVDDFMRTSRQNVFACGDVAEHKGSIYGIWPVAKEQGYSAGMNVSGIKSEYHGSVLSTRLKVVGIDLASVGNIAAGEGIEVISKKDEQKGIYKKIFLKENKLVGAILLGEGGAGAKMQEMIKSSEDMTFLKHQLI